MIIVNVPLGFYWKRLWFTSLLRSIVITALIACYLHCFQHTREMLGRENRQSINVYDNALFRLLVGWIDRLIEHISTIRYLRRFFYQRQRCRKCPRSLILLVMYVNLKINIKIKINLVWLVACHIKTPY